ncbi:unnamed protein product [Allacma fusca]|uniref:Uncharacterized protein n=1 Tax=Allacma fusca TaxID=39272 RepID=A0A8J2KCD7_9HEXA|nr:unnamed protein product [Allacma fusca]
MGELSGNLGRSWSIGRVGVRNGKVGEECRMLVQERRDVCSLSFVEFQCGARKSQCMSAISAGKVYVGKLAPISIKIHGPMQHSPLQLRQKLIDTVDDKYHSTASSSTRHHKKSKRKKYKNHFDDLRSKSESSPKSSRFDVGKTSKLSRDPLTDDNKNTFLFDEESRMDLDSDLTSCQRLRNNKTGMSVLGSVLDDPPRDDPLLEDEDDDFDADGSSSRTRRPIDVDTLHKEQVPNVNGNLDPDGQFHKWHQTYAVPSINGELLHILPYTVIDF